MNKYANNRFLLNSIDLHKKIVAGEAVDLASTNFEEGTPLEYVHKYNAFTILTKLEFDRDEATDPASDSAKYLDDLAVKDLSSEQIIQSLLEYREKVVNS